MVPARNRSFSGRARKSFFPFLSLLFVLAASPAAVRGASLEPAIRDSHFIFAGTVERPAASNVSLLPSSDRTAIVRVRAVVDQPDVFPGLRDAEVTVQAADARDLTEGATGIFFSTSLMYGEHLAVSEVYRIATRLESESSDLDAVSREVSRVRALEADEDLAARLSRAEAVVYGKVEKVLPLERREGDREDFGEHAASWALATIGVEKALKGREGSAVYFAQDTDFFWATTPKLAMGEEGIFLLQPYRGRDLPEGSYVVVDALDVQPPGELERIVGLLR